MLDGLTRADPRSARPPGLMRTAHEQRRRRSPAYRRGGLIGCSLKRLSQQKPGEE